MSPVVVPPAGMSGQPGWFLKVVRDQRFAGFLAILGQGLYLVALVCAYVIATLVAFVLYRFVVFRVRGHVLADLWRFLTVYISQLAVNFVLLFVLVSIVHMRPVLLAQVLIMLVTTVISWTGHKHFSFRRTGSPEDLHR
jgi:putative flippase GtrA